MWTIPLAQAEIIASEGEKDVRAKSKDGIKTSVDTRAQAN